MTTSKAGTRWHTRAAGVGLTMAWVAVAVACTPTAARSQTVENASYQTSEGEPVEAQSIVVPADVSQVWRVFTTKEGLMSWAVPFADIDLRVGGVWESSYEADAKVGDTGNIKNRILAYLPERMMALKAESAPPDFAHPEVLADVFSVLEFEPLDGGHTRIRIYGVGYKDTPAHQAVRDFFREANGWSLEMLYKHFAEGGI